MTFIVNIKTEEFCSFSFDDPVGPFFLIKKDGDSQEDINLINFRLSSYNISDAYLDYWKYV